MGITKPRIHVRFPPFPPYHLDPQPLLLGITRKPMKINPVFLAVASSTANSTATRRHSSSHGQLFVLLPYKIQQHANHVILIATMPTEASRLYIPSRHHTSSLLLVSLSAIAVWPFAHCAYICAMPDRVENRARPALKLARRLQRFIIGPAGFKAGRPALNPAGFQAGQVYNRALTYILLLICCLHFGLYLVYGRIRTWRSKE